MRLADGWGWCLTRVLAVVAVLAAVVLASPAYAAKTPPAVAAYEGGKAAYNAGDYADALKQFQKAYKLRPAPLLLVNIAQCHRQLGNHEAAVEALTRYLAAAPDAANRADVETLLAQERAELPPDSAEPAGTPPGAPAAEPAGESAPTTAAPPEEPAPAPAGTTADEDPGLFVNPLFWGAVGGAALLVVAGGTLAAVATTSAATQPPPVERKTTLGTFDMR